MQKDFGAKMSKKLVESGAKIRLFGSIFGDQGYRND